MSNHKLCPFHYVILLFTLVQIFLLSSCAGTSDWSFSDLPGDYEIWRINSKEIVLVKKTDDVLGESVVDAYVSKVAWDDNFILAQQESNADNTSNTVSFYIVDVNSENIYGPLTEDEFNELAKQIQVEVNNMDWILTSDLAP